MNRDKTRKIAYWIFTLWLALGMVSTGVVQLMRIPSETDFILRLGYPAYLLVLLGATKLLGVVAVLVPRYPLLKEWAYAGFFFTMAGATYSHLVSGSPLKDLFPAVLLLALVVLSWALRPEERRVALA